MEIKQTPGKKLPDKDNDAAHEGTNKHLFHVLEVLV